MDKKNVDTKNVDTSNAPAKRAVKMIETQSGADDGINVRKFLEGEEYVLGEDLAREFVNAGWAVYVDEKGHKSAAHAPTTAAATADKRDHEKDVTPLTTHNTPHATTHAGHASHATHAAHPTHAKDTHAKK